MPLGTQLFSLEQKAGSIAGPSLDIKVALEDDRLSPCRCTLAPSAEEFTADAIALGKYLLLRIPARSRFQLQQALMGIPPDTPFAVLTRPDPRRAVRLVWRPGQKMVEGIRPWGSADTPVTGTFVVLEPSLEGDGGRVREDGFVVHLNPPSWQRIREAVENGQDVSVAASRNGFGFTLEWIDDLGKPLRKESQLEQSEAVTPASMQGSAVLTHAFSFCSAYRLKQRVSIIALASFTQAIDEVVQQHFAPSAMTGQAQRVVITCALRPGSSVRFWVETEIGMSKASVEGLMNRLQGLPPPQVLHGPIGFMLSFKTGDPGAAGPLFFGEIPRAWLLALIPGKQLTIDELISQSWYL
jgi:hypothetical protein